MLECFSIHGKSASKCVERSEKYRKKKEEVIATMLTSQMGSVECVQKTEKP